MICLARGTDQHLNSGTPNSGTTSLSALSTTAIKDGHQGHAPPHGHHHHHTSSNASNSSTTTLDAERADRISRLAGLERVATVRQGATGPTTNQSQVSGPAAISGTQPPGYFDSTGTPMMGKERSTVGSASATGSAGGRTTWASGSDVYDHDKMSEDDVSSTGFSDEGNASLVGFGETASSTISGPVSNPHGNRFVQSQRTGTPGSPMQGVQAERAKMLDGVTYDNDIVDTTSRGPVSATDGRNAGMTGVETSERIVRDRLNASGGDTAMDISEEQK